MADDNAGGPLESITDGVFGGEQEVDAVTDAAQHYLDMAKAGEWAIDEETGTHLRNVFAYALRRLGEINAKTYRLEQAPKVGNDKYAQQVSQHMLDSVNSDERSLVPVVYAIQDALTKWHEAVDEAMKHYSAADEAATEHFGAFKD